MGSSRTRWVLKPEACSRSFAARSAANVPTSMGAEGNPAIAGAVGDAAFATRVPAGQTDHEGRHSSLAGRGALSEFARAWFGQAERK
jgi:hypothetical protein